MTAPRHPYRKAWNNVLIGLLLVAPLVATFAVVKWLFDVITGKLIFFLPAEVKTGLSGFGLRVLALFVLLLLLFCIGLLARNLIGRRLYHAGDRILSSLPGISTIYKFVREVISVFFASKDSSFKEVVLIEYPRTGVLSLGFVTASVPDDLSPAQYRGQNCVSVFIPTTPNPTSGWFCIVPRDSLQILSLTPAEGMKLVVSGGAIYPGAKTAVPESSLLDKLEALVDKEPASPPTETPT